jgi:hypothetical protein
MAEPARTAAAPEYPPLRGAKLLFLTAAIATASFMEILDMTIVNVSVPAISGSLGVSTSEGTWSILRHRESNRVKLPIDAVGLTLLIIGVGSLQFMLDNGNEKDWFSSPVIIVAGVVSLVSMSFLIPWELTDKHPVIDLHLYRRRNFRVGTCVIGVAFLWLAKPPFTARGADAAH